VNIQLNVVTFSAYPKNNNLFETCCHSVCATSGCNCHTAEWSVVRRQPGSNSPWKCLVPVRFAGFARDSWIRALFKRGYFIEHCEMQEHRLLLRRNVSCGVFCDNVIPTAPLRKFLHPSRKKLSVE